VIVAPHPDDEVLGIGGVLMQLAQHSREILIVAVSDGDASHPGSLHWPAPMLARQRAQETEMALARLGVTGASIIRAGLQDGALGKAEQKLCELLSQYVGPDDVVFSTWRQDGHPDHEAVGRASARAAANAQAAHVEFPVWMWHWAVPGDACVPWQRAWRVDVPADAMACKKQAMAAYVSQIEPDASTGRPAIVPPEVQAYFHRSFEMVFQ
jgi:LmbE family N-acetylglucosaminyl deacetylase